MDLIVLNIRKILNWNFIFMSLIATFFGTLSLMNLNDFSKEILFNLNIKYLLLDGYICLFIFFASEISKSMLQEEKITRRIEWKLANGIKLKSIIIENTLSLLLTTILLLFPLLFIVCINIPNIILLLNTYFLMLCMLYSLFINIIILWIRNMNWFKTIPVFATLVHILITILKYILFIKTENALVLLLFSLVSIIFLTIYILCLLNKEHIVSSYF